MHGMTKERFMVEREARPVLRPDVVLREETDDWAVLFDPGTGDAYGLDPVGVFVAKRLDGRNSLFEITEQVTLLFEDVPPEVDQEVSEFVDSLVRKGLAEI